MVAFFRSFRYNSGIACLYVKYRFLRCEMKGFLQKHSYSMVKMFLNQFATAIFGFVLALAVSYANNTGLRNVTSICAVVFYLFLLYTITWDIGFADRVSVMSGKQKRNV